MTRKKVREIKTEPVLKEEPFHVFQFAKIEGLRGYEKYKKSAFVSPLFGTSVKDEVSAPWAAKDTGATVKTYDAFRIDKKLDDDNVSREKGHKYYEFTDIITNKTRKVYFGEDAFIKQKDDPKKVVEVPKLVPISDRPIEINETKPVREEYVPKAPISFSKPAQPFEVADIDVEENLEIETFETNYKDRQPQNIADVETIVIKKSDSSNAREEDNEDAAYRLPNVQMFKKVERDLNEKPKWVLDQIDIINNTLLEFGVEGTVINSKKGPTVTRYEINLEAGVNVKRVSNIENNIMMNLAASSLRIEAPIPGKPYVGIEVPNVEKEIVAFGNCVDDKEFYGDFEHPLKIALGVDIDGTNIYADIGKMPHGLVAGATNSGKSVCINTILVSLLLKNHPDDLKLILVDPKMVELTPYDGLPHLITPVITDAKIAASALSWAVDEMEKRYQRFSKNRSRDIKSFNENVKRGYVDEEKMPWIVVVIDELADLMMVASHEVEDSIQRLTQKARAAGIHLLVATQRPTTDVVKGTIKSNIPTRIAFKVSSFVDSTTILDGAGAESLLGKGDMLFKEGDKIIRLQGAYIPDGEIYDVTDYIRAQRSPNYIFKHEDLKQQMRIKESTQDDLFETIAYFVVDAGETVSINNISKEFNIGFNRAQRIIEMLEQYKIVSPSQGTKAREVLVSKDDLDEMFGK